VRGGGARDDRLGGEKGCPCRVALPCSFLWTGSGEEVADIVMGHAKCRQRFGGARVLLQFTS
jgi:hypothetical protein